MTYYKYSFGTINNITHYLFFGSITLVSTYFLPNTKKINLLAGFSSTLFHVFLINFCSYNRNKYIENFKNITGNDLYITEVNIDWLNTIHYGFVTKNGVTRKYEIGKIDKMMSDIKNKRLLLYLNNKCQESLIYKDKVPKDIITEIIKNID